MRITPPPLDDDFRQAQLRDLQHLVAQPSDRDQRPCAGCDLVCPDCGSRRCTCCCQPGCPEAPRRLSSEPERFPVEPGIVPLVYAFSSLRLLPTCWSCEGHNDAAGKLRRPPSVWFFSRKLIYPSLVAGLLSRLRSAGRVGHDWQVTSLHCGIETDSVFAVEPRLQPDEHVGLKRLRGDTAIIAARLGEGVRALARSRIAALNERRGAGRQSLRT
jgi:hypothetical protein